MIDFRDTNGRHSGIKIRALYCRIGADNGMNYVKIVLT